MTAHIEAALRAALQQRASSTIITESEYRIADVRGVVPTSGSLAQTASLLHTVVVFRPILHAIGGTPMTQDGAVISTEDLPAFTPAPGATLRMLTGESHGLGMCLIVAEYPPGAETPSHRHPNSSAIFVREGHGMFKVGETELAAGPGDIVLVPAKAWHSFRNDGDDWLRILGADEGPRHDAELAPQSE